MTTETNDTPPGWKLVPVELVEALGKIMPARVQDGPDYAEVYFSDGNSHSTQAMTVNPQDWRDLQAAFDMLAASPEPPARHLPSREEIAVTIQRIEESGVRIPDGYADGHVAGVARIDHSEVSDWSAFMADAILSLLRGDTANGGEG